MEEIFGLADLGKEPHICCDVYGLDVLSENIENRHHFQEKCSLLGFLYLFIRVFNLREH